MNRLTWSRPHIRAWRAFDRLYSVCLPQNSRADRSYLIREYQPQTRLAWRDGALVGFFVAWKSASPDTAWLESIGVAPSERGSGFSTELLKAAEEEVSSLGCTRIELAVDGYNQIAIRFYRRHGYEPVARPGEKLTFAKALSPISKSMNQATERNSWIYTSRTSTARALRLALYRVMTA